MTDDRRRGRPAGLLQSLAWQLERRVAEEAASGAIRGAAEGLREALPEREAELRSLLEDSVTVLARVAKKAVEENGVDAEALVQRVARAAAAGIVEQLNASEPNAGPPLKQILGHLDTLFVHAVESGKSQAAEAGPRAKAASSAFFEGVLDQLHQALPRILADLEASAPVGERLGRHLGKGFMEGVQAAGPRPASIEELTASVARGLVRGVMEGLGASLRPALSSGWRSLQTGWRSHGSTVKAVGGAGLLLVALARLSR